MLLTLSLVTAAELPASILSQSPPTAERAGETSGPERTRPYLMEVNFRGRYMQVPDSVLDIWYFTDRDDSGTHVGRPSITAYAAGLEFAVRNDTQMGVFYFDYFGNLTPDGYWDDIESPIQVPYDGDWVHFQNFSVIAVGADYYYDIRIAPWVSFLVGAGLGAGFILGEIQHWDSNGGKPDPGAQEEVYEQVPNAVPILDINAGIKFHFNDRANLRIEGGLHNLLYVGGALGVVF